MKLAEAPGEPKLRLRAAILVLAVVTLVTTYESDVLVNTITVATSAVLA